MHGEDATLHPAFSTMLSSICGPVAMHIRSGAYGDSELITSFYTLLSNVLTRPSTVSIAEQCEGIQVAMETAIGCLLKVCN